MNPHIPLSVPRPPHISEIASYFRNKVFELHSSSLRTLTSPPLSVPRPPTIFEKKINFYGFG